MSKPYYSYIRVSTVKQGQTGTSLDEQREAIKRYAERHSLVISREFEEKETAAKGGRPIFTQMLKALRQEQARGVIIHKIDRSARNLRDWAELGELIDSGVEVLFANENLDLHSRGGRLSADIQAVVAADYIRNLREEVIKGFYGRIKQGLYPMPAPLGYLDQGQGKPKIPDPIMAPLVRKLFELDATGNYSIVRLVDTMYTMGLRTKPGGKLTKTGVAGCLHNPFYIGLIRIQKTGELYPGLHQPIISKPLFDQVQAVLSGKAVGKQQTHAFLFRRLLHCARCKTTLTGEKQKGHIYYRCHTRTCDQKTIREEIVNDTLIDVFETLRFSAAETRYFRQQIEKLHQDAEGFSQAQQKALKLQQEQTQSRLSKLTDAYLDGMIEPEIYREKKNAYVTEAQEIKQQLEHLDEKLPLLLRQLEEFLELANNANLSYKAANCEEKRELVQILTSNLIIDGKSVSPKLNFPFQVVFERQEVVNGGPHRDRLRILSALVSQLWKYFQDQTANLDNAQSLVSQN